MIDAFSSQHSTILYDSDCPLTRRPKSSLYCLIPNQENCRTQRHLIRLFAVNDNKNTQHQPIADRSYDFIAIEEADKMLQQERIRNEQEIREMKTLLEHQRQELHKYESLDSFVQLSKQEDDSEIDLGFDGCEDNKCSYDVEKNSENDGSNESNDEYFFSTPFPTNIGEEQYKQQHGRSHSNAECRTLEISIQQIYEENEDLKDEFNYQHNRYSSDIEEKQRMIYDLRERCDGNQHELNLEISYFERAKAELEEVLDQERSKARELEQHLLLACREKEILEKAVAEAQHQEQDLREQEHRKRQQRQIQLEQEERERQEQQLQQEQEERLRHEELLRNHKELVELEKYQKEFNDLCFDIFNHDNVNKKINDNLVQNKNHGEQKEDVVVGNVGQELQQYEKSVDSASSMHSSESTTSTQFDTVQQLHHHHQQQAYERWRDQEQQPFSIPLTTEISTPGDQKQNSRKNSHAHGIFMNFNDILL